MNKFTFSSGMLKLVFFISPLSANAYLQGHALDPIIDTDIIKQYTQQHQPNANQTKSACIKANGQSNLFYQDQSHQNQQDKQKQSVIKITKDEEDCLDKKYLFTQWGQETVIAHCDVKQNRDFFSDCFIYTKKGNEYSYYAQLIMDSRDRKAHFFRDEFDINSFKDIDAAVKERNANRYVPFNMIYSINRNGGLELHLFEGSSSKFLYTQTINQM